MKAAVIVTGNAIAKGHSGKTGKFNLRLQGRGCGSCLMQVLEGWDNLSVPSVIEEKILGKIAAGKNQRLACQAQVMGDIKITAA